MLYHLRKLRPLLSTEPEYRIRRLAYKLIPSKQAPIDALFHCCTYKTASQWVRLLLSDPRFYSATGLEPHHGPHVMQAFNDNPSVAVPTPSVVASLMIDYQTLQMLPKPKRWRAFFVLRDPKDLVVSRYFSDRFSHRMYGKLGEVRTTMEGMSEEEGLLYILEHRFDDIATIIRSWLGAQHDPQDGHRIEIVRFEDVTGEAKVRVWSELLTKLEVPVSTDRLESVLNFYRQSRLSPPKKAASNGTIEKYRSGKQGQWADHFTQPVADLFDEKYGKLAIEMGYRR